jgi:VanZ family protein
MAEDFATKVSSAARFFAWSLIAIIIFLTYVPPSLRPVTGAPHNLEHFVIFFAAGVAFGLGYSRNPAAVALALALFAGVLELGQLFVPGRDARWIDFAVDATALVTGVALGWRTQATLRLRSVRRR